MHRYSSHGEFPVQLVIYDANGCPDTAAIIASVLPSPFVSFSLPEVECEGDTLHSLTFQDQGAQLVSYSWMLSDGTAASSRNVQHAFERPGQYFVQLAIANDNGCADTLTQAVNITQKPNVAFEITEMCLGTL